MEDAMRATDAATALGHVLGAELRACGIDLSFAPVLDLDHGRSQVIADRAFHRDARVVSLLAKSVMHGLLRAGMAHCAKHFPGHGYAEADSHVALPVDSRPLADILADDAAPYGWLGSTLAAVMPAHVVYPAVDDRPAGFSPHWLNDILRAELGFTGAVISDDLTMEAARHLHGSTLTLTEAAVLALQAGCDLLLLCNQQADGGRAIDEVLRGLQAAAQDGRWQPTIDSESRRLALLPQTAPLAWDDLMHDPVYQQALERLP
jgi:beta-N-acetylhexosaminidase